MDILIEESTMMGEANMIREQMDNNHSLKETIMLRLEQEDGQGQQAHAEICTR